MTSDDRREIAARLREAAIDDGHIGRPYGEQGFQVTLRRIIGTSNPRRSTLYARLANLIDPTCYELGSWCESGMYYPTIYHHELSCGHVITTPYGVLPEYCDECGARIVDDD